MAKKPQITREGILEAALSLLRQGGEDALNARALAGALGCSTQPIFRNFESMEALRAAVLEAVHDRYLRFISDWSAGRSEPRYKAEGLAYIAFAKAEPAFFRLQFMRDRAGGDEGPETADWEQTVRAVAEYTGLDRQRAELFHLEMWALVHGVAVMEATGYLDLDEATVSRMVSDVYLGIRRHWEELECMQSKQER